MLLGDSDDLLRKNFIEKTIREIKKSRYDFVILIILK